MHARYILKYSIWFKMRKVYFSRKVYSLYQKSARVLIRTEYKWDQFRGQHLPRNAEPHKYSNMHVFLSCKFLLVLFHFIITIFQYQVWQHDVILLNHPPSLSRKFSF